MLKKSERVSRKEFATYFKTGIRNVSEYVTIITASYPQFKAAVVVGKKVYADAVLRNRLRRQVYGLIERYQGKRSGVVLVLLKPASATLSNKTRVRILEEELGRVLK